VRTITHLYSHGGIELDCTLEYDPGEPAGMVSPAVAPAAYLISAKVSEVDILPILGDDIIEKIEDDAVWSMLS
jgi:hypothetical protein